MENKGWVKAQDLIITDTLQLDNRAQVSINDLRTETLEQEVTVYNFEVEDNHTYYVSESNVLCHNMCKPKKSGTYKLEFKSGKQYIGKGGTARMKQSIRRIEKTGDTLKMKKFRPASTDKEAFIREAKWMQKASKKRIDLYN